MPAYVIADLDVHDAAAYEDYRTRVRPVVERFGGRFLVRGGRSETLEGDWKPRRLVVVEFPSMDRAMQFYRSPEYRPLLELRLRAARSTVVVVEGA
ncbi:MAG TPA: DUF1330 domain-containing protein [Candidatus Tectomicrobia bacterium]|nr:DUF1330 domain-containing protein [Candidatus Tectomicrobia bacterium]